MNGGCISVLLLRLFKLLRECYSNGTGNETGILGNLGSNMEIQP